MFSVRKRSANVAAATGFCLCESATTAKGFYLRESEAAAATTKAAHRTPPGSSALCESEATATNVLSVRKRSDSNKCFICAKAKRQRQSAQPERKSTTR
ncbi:hypothetical protein [Lysinibacillus xylanilyticus]|uniref:hypothetical protein n=1 Tax=Lysinibacillus xylanilyticus TaxID=582475 RepID=UPI003D03F843